MFSDGSQFWPLAKPERRKNWSLSNIPGVHRLSIKCRLQHQQLCIYINKTVIKNNIDFKLLCYLTEDRQWTYKTVYFNRVSNVSKAKQYSHYQPKYSKCMRPKGAFVNGTKLTIMQNQFKKKINANHSANTCISETVV